LALQYRGVDLTCIGRYESGPEQATPSALVIVIRGCWSSFDGLATAW
jgi:hypothetical protein